MPKHKQTSGIIISCLLSAQASFAAVNQGVPQRGLGKVFGSISAPMQVRVAQFLGSNLTLESVRALREGLASIPPSKDEPGGVASPAPAWQNIPIEERNFLAEGSDPADVAAKLTQLSHLMTPYVAQPVLHGLEDDAAIIRRDLAGETRSIAVPAQRIQSVVSRAELAALYGRVLSLSDAELVAQDRIPPISLLVDSRGSPVGANPDAFFPSWMARDGDTLGVFKPVPAAPTSEEYSYKRTKPMLEVAGAHVMRSMNVPTADYRLAYAMVGEVQKIGAFTPFIQGLQTARRRPDLFENIADPDVFVRGAIINAWMGDTDKQSNLGNTWGVQKGDALTSIFGDYDATWRLGTLFGLPRVPIRPFLRYARPEAVGRALADILALSDADIHKMVQEAFVSIGGVHQSVHDFLAGVLIYNREKMRDASAFDWLLSGGKPRLRLSPDEVAALASVVLQGRTMERTEIGTEVQNVLGQLPPWFSQYEPQMRILFTQILAGVPGVGAVMTLEFDELDAISPIISFVHSRFTPEEAVRSFGYHH